MDLRYPKNCIAPFLAFDFVGVLFDFTKTFLGLVDGCFICWWLLLISLVFLKKKESKFQQSLRPSLARFVSSDLFGTAEVRGEKNQS